MRVEVDGVATPLRVNTLSADNAIGQRSTGSLLLRDDAGAFHYEMGQRVDLFDDAQGDLLVFSGVIDDDDEDAVGQSNFIGLSHKVDMLDWHYLADKRLVAKSYIAGLLAGDVFSDVLLNFLAEEGVVGVRTPPAFARTSVAYRASDGVQVSSGAPRYEPVAANMLTAVQSTIASASLPDPDYKGSLGAGGSIAQDTSVFWQGAGSLRAIADGSATFQSVSVNLPKSAYTALATYTFSAWMKAQSGTPTIRFYCQANDLIAGNASLGSVGSVTLSTSWARYSFTVTMPADLSPYSIIGLRADTGGVAQAITWYLDGLQIESGASLSAWVVGGSPSGSALRVEEATTNLYSANQSSVETDTTGFSLVNGATITRDTTEHWSGSASLKAACPGVQSGEGFWAMIAAASYTASGVVTLSVWLKASASAVVDVYMWHDSPSASVFGPATVTLTTSWQRVTLTGAMPGSLTNNYGIRVGTHNTQAVNIFADGLQVEKKNRPTSWQIGGTARNVETLKLPGLGGVRPEQGTIQLSAYFDAAVRTQTTPSNGGNLFGVDIGPVAGNGGALSLFHSNNTANWVMNINSTDFPAFSDTHTPDGWHDLAVAWDKASLLVYVDGVLRATQNNPHLAASFAPFLYIGSNGIGGDQGNTLYRNVRISPRKRTAAEIAADALAVSPLPLDNTASYRASLNGSLAFLTHIADGATLPDVVFDYAYASDCFDALAKKSQGYWWQIDQYKMAWLQPYAAIAAPWSLTADGNGVVVDARLGSVKVKRAKPKYRNKQYIRGVTGQTSSQVETRKGDGTATAFTLNYPIAKVPTVEVQIGAGSFVAKTVGIKGLDSGKDWYWNGGDAVVSQDSGGVKLTSADTLRVTYVGQFPLVVISEDTAEITAQQTLEGGGTSGKVESVTSDASLTTTDAAFTEASALLAKYAQRCTQLRFSTSRAGLAPGQLIHVTIPVHGLDNDLLIESVHIGDQDGVLIWYDVVALLGPINDSWVQFFGGLVKDAESGGDTLQVGASSTLVTSNTFTATASPSASYTATVYACPLFPAVFPLTLC